jgi:hypothetical protein
MRLFVIKELKIRIFVGGIKDVKLDYFSFFLKIS